MSAVLGTKKLYSNPIAKANSIKTTSTASAPKTNGFGNFIFMHFCPQAKVYLILAFLTLLYFVSIEQGLIWLIPKAIIFIGVAFGLNKLCSSGNKAIAWLLATVPQCIYLLMSLKSPSSSGKGPVPAAMPTV